VSRLEKAKNGMANARKTVLIIVYSGALRNALKAMLSMVLDLEVLGVAELPAVGLRMTAEQRPDIVVLDSRPNLEATLTTLQQIRLVSPHSQRVLFVDEMLSLSVAEHAPAELVLLKGMAPGDVLAAIGQLVAHLEDKDDK
jgi:chemotaxis response regulator CheB